MKQEIDKVSVTAIEPTKTNPIKQHHLLMGACVVAMALPFVLTRSFDSEWLGYAALALCPLLHIWMMKKGKSCHK